MWDGDEVEAELVPVPHPSLPCTLTGCRRAGPEGRAQVPGEAHPITPWKPILDNNESNVHLKVVQILVWPKPRRLQTK